MEFIIIGIVSALNLIVIVQKFKKGRVEDGIFDSILFAVLTSMFSGSYGGMVVAMIASLVISLYLWASPPAFFKTLTRRDDVQQAVKDLKGLVKEKPKDKKHGDINFD